MDALRREHAVRVQHDVLLGHGGSRRARWRATSPLARRAPVCLDHVSFHSGINTAFLAALVGGHVELIGGAETDQGRPRRQPTWVAGPDGTSER